MFIKTIAYISEKQPSVVAVKCFLANANVPAMNNTKNTRCKNAVSKEIATDVVIFALKMNLCVIAKITINPKIDIGSGRRKSAAKSIIPLNAIKSDVLIFFDLSFAFAPMLTKKAAIIAKTTLNDFTNKRHQLLCFS